MRLINTTTLKFKEFTDCDVPPYAILSHTWGQTHEEVSYQDYVRGSRRKEKGFAKIMKTIEIARANGIKFVWIDSCCIDKRSSAELTEAINSMYRYYERSQVCYAFLSDLKTDGDLSTDLPHCRWFKRGWTLQELVAPLVVHIYDCDWSYRGSKESLSPLLSQISGIDEDVLLHRRPLRSICVAQRMAWASSRSTTRIEDLSYSLLGIFGVNMPLLYGEGERAFRRLQEEIIKSSSDLSILAWTDPRDQHDEKCSEIHCGVLAESPASFAAAGSIHGLPGMAPVGECSVTNQGIRLYSPLKFMCDADTIIEKPCYVLPLYCHSATGEQLGIRLRKIGDENYLRTDPCTLTQYDRIKSTLSRRFRYLALETPYTSGFRSASKQAFTEKSLIWMRRHVLRLNFRCDITTSDYWGGVYDHTERMFFDTAGQPREWVAIKFTIWSIKSTTLLLYIVGWTCTTNKQPEWWLVDTKAYATQVADVQKIFDIWEYDVDAARFVMEEHGIPKSSRIEVPVPDTNLTNCIWIEPARTIDPTRCSYPFWTFHVYRELRSNLVQRYKEVSVPPRPKNPINDHRLAIMRRESKEVKFVGDTEAYERTGDVAGSLWPFSSLDLCSE